MNQLTVIPADRPIQQPTRRLVSLIELWTVFVKLKGDIAPATRDEYRSIGNRFCEFMSGKDLNPQSMVDWTMMLQSHQFRKKDKYFPVSHSHINKINFRVKAFLHWLKRMGYILYDLADAVPTLTPNAPKEADIFTEAEYEKIKTYAAGRNWCQVHLWLCILAYRTGMSKVDCCYLRWEAVTLNENGPSYIDISRIKTQRLKHRQHCNIPIIPFSDLHQWLIVLKQRAHLNYKRFDGINDYVHQDAPGLYECRWQSLNNDFKNLFARAGVTGKTFRHFRHTFISNLVNSDAQLALICKMTGHTNVKTLLKYLKPDRRALQDALAKATHYAASQSGIGKSTDGFDPCITTPITK